MADWRYTGSAVRRREGAPSSHMDSLGAAPRVSLPTPEEALAGMARVGSPRIPMGMSAITDFANAQPVPPLKGDLVPKTGNAKGDVDPYAIPGMEVRDNVPIKSPKSGAAYRIKAFVPPTTDPAATATQANGRIVPSSMSREGAWGDGMMGAYKGY